MTAPRLHLVRGGVALAATLLLSATVVTNATEDEGRTVFDAQCGMCHGARDIAYWADQYPVADERQAWLDGFLQRHYPPSDRERSLIVDYIEDVIADADANR